MPSWFLIINGTGLLLIGLWQLFTRIRERPLYRHFMGIVWALVCCGAGVGLLLMAKGFITQPGFSPRRPAVKDTRRPGDLEFPSGR